MARQVFRWVKTAVNGGVLRPFSRSELIHKINFLNVSALQNWCPGSSLEMNICKTKELIMQNGYDLVQPLMINGQMVEIVNNFKHLGTYIDSSLSFKENTNQIFFLKCSQRLYLLRKLNNFGVNYKISTLWIIKFSYSYS